VQGPPVRPGRRRCAVRGVLRGAHRHGDAGARGWMDGCVLLPSMTPSSEQQRAAALFKPQTEPTAPSTPQVRGSQRLRHAPSPLSTLDFQKRGTQYLRLPGALRWLGAVALSVTAPKVTRTWFGVCWCRLIVANNPLPKPKTQPPTPPHQQHPGERLMKLAEELYQAGYLSYPRTETDAFDPGMDLLVSCAALCCAALCCAVLGVSFVRCAVGVWECALRAVLCCAVGKGGSSAF